MASKNEFEMLFALNARMNSGFSSTFSKAQAEFTQLGKEIQSLHKVQGDIASYQKQQSAIEATRGKLESLQKQHDLLQKEISETTGSTSGLEREKVKLEERIKNTEVALERQSQKLEATGTRLKEAGVDTANLAQKDQELTAKIKELEAEQNKAADSAASFGETASKAFDAIGQSIITSYIVEGLTSIKDAFAECIGVAAEFEETMSTVEALSGANSQDMAALTEAAKELGATTKYTAAESAEAMTYMAMAGWDAQQMLDGMSGVINLAAASGEDLARVSDIVTDNLTAFGLTAADTARFADVLAATATNSNTSVSVMGETFKNAASIAGALGYSVEDVSVAIGLMANAGVKGSIAGTALKNTFNGLLEGATLTANAFGEFEFTAIKADGTMKSFSETINELRVYFDQMTEAERVNNAMALAGQRGYNGLLAILNATDADYASLTNSINNCTGAAQRMANIKLDNLNGQLTLMNSAWDALKTTIGEQFIPEIRTLYELGTDVFSGLNKFIKAHPGIVKGIAAGAAVIGTVTMALTAYAAGAKIAAAASALLSASIPGVNIIMGVTAAVAGVVGVVTALTSATDDSIPSIKDLTEAASEMQDAMADARASYDSTVDSTVAAANVADRYITKLEEMGEYTELTTEQKKEYHSTLALLCQTVPELAGYINLETDSIIGGTKALRANTEAWRQNAIQQAFQAQLTEMYRAQADVLLEAERNRMGMTEAEERAGAINEELNELYERRNEIIRHAKAAADAANEANNNYAADWRQFIGDEAEEYGELGRQISALEVEYKNSVATADAYRAALKEDNEAIAEAEAAINNVTQAINNLTGATEDQIAAQTEAARQTELLNAVIGDTMEQIASLVEAYEEAYDAAYSSISGQYALWDEAEKVVATSVGSMNKAMESQITYWQNYNTNLESLRERTGDIEGLSDVIASFADGSKDSVNAIAGMAQASDEELAAMVENWKTLQEEQETAAGSIADLKTDFTATMDELQTELAADINAMNLGKEAEEAGRATLQGYIDGANAMLPQVQAAYASLAKAAQSALFTPIMANTTSAGVDPSSWSGLSYRGIPTPGELSQMTRAWRGYASGTDNAAPGWAEVGENGPELMFFNGGEKVLNAAQTAALRNKARPALSAIPSPSGAGGGAPSIQLTVHVDGNATQETVDALSAGAEGIIEEIMDRLEYAEADRRRRSMS